jgi:menaquinone-9 beta-reductase
LVEKEINYDCGIVGGGLAGLCLAIQLRQYGHSVILFEKNEYPFHKVCGEYISMESWDFINSLGLNLGNFDLPKINQLGISSENGFMLETPLKLGGFGISRHTLDFELFKIAEKLGVKIFTNCKVFNTLELEQGNQIKTSKGDFFSKLLCGTYGRFTPSYIEKKNAEIKNYIGVKYHIKTKLAGNRIELHNFKDGYCGISKVDKDRFCMCYLTTSKNLKDNGNDVGEMESVVLKKNPFLKKYFEESEFLFDKPLTISQVSFKKKSTFKNGIFLLGDAAGAIAPLCGNGMSMAMRSSKLLSILIDDYFNKQIAYNDLVLGYKKQWNSNFSARISAGFYLQKLFGRNLPTHLSLLMLNKMPALTNKLVSLTHGKPF